MKKLLGILMKNIKQLEDLMRFSSMLSSEFLCKFDLTMDGGYYHHHLLVRSVNTILHNKRAKFDTSMKLSRHM